MYLGFCVTRTNTFFFPRSNVLYEHGSTDPQNVTFPLILHQIQHV